MSTLTLIFRIVISTSKLTYQYFSVSLFPLNFNTEMNSDNFHIIESLNLLLVSHHSTFKKENIESILNEFDVNPFFTNGVKALIDMRKAVILANMDEIKEISVLVFEKLKDRNIDKLAILIDTSQINKVVEFVKAYQQSSNYQVFAKLEGALHWLKIPSERKEQIEVKLDYLERH